LFVYVVIVLNKYVLWTAGNSLNLRKLFTVLKEYCKQKEEAVDRLMWGT